MSFSSQTFRGRATIESASSPKVYNLTSPITPLTEFSQLLSDGVKKIIIRSRGNSDILVSFESGMSEFFTIPCGATYSDDNLNLNNVTLYLKTSKASEIVEILEWS